MKTKLSIKEGTVNFWLKEDFIKNTRDLVIDMFILDPDGGSIKVMKDNDNKLKIFFVEIGKGRFDLDFDVSGLNNDRHMITLTWSDNLKLYVDGDLKKELPRV